MSVMSDLDLSRTQVTGSISSLRGLSLRNLWLGDTQVSGDIVAFGAMTDLIWLDLSNLKNVYGATYSLRNLVHLEVRFPVEMKILQ